MLRKSEALAVFKNFLIELPFEILAFIIVPIALIFCGKDSERLPKWAAWFDENDYGINGDDGWKSEHFKPPLNRTYFARLCWLLRNRIGVFSAKFLGVKVKDIKASSIRVYGDKNITKSDEFSGFCKVECELNNGKKRFGYYRIIRYGKSGFVRIYLGHKLLDIADIKSEADKQAYLAKKDNKPVLKSVWCINPFRTLKK